MRHPVRLIRTLALVGTLGACYQIPGCGLSGLRNLITGINPCGTILACDPREFEFITSGYRGPGVNPAIDPYCVFPPFCSQAQDPIFGGLGGGP